MILTFGGRSEDDEVLELRYIVHYQGRLGVLGRPESKIVSTTLNISNDPDCLIETHPQARPRMTNSLLSLVMIRAQPALGHQLTSELQQGLLQLQPLRRQLRLACEARRPLLLLSRLLLALLMLANATAAGCDYIMG